MIGFFRLYVKSIQGSSYYRIESKQVNQEIRYAIPEIMNISQTINQSYYNSNKFQYIELVITAKELFPLNFAW